MVAIDILGPLPVTLAGNKYILVAADYFSKWIEAYAIPNQEATTIARKLLDEMFCRFALPEKLHSDQGRQFEAEVTTQLCQFLQIEKTRTTPYHPQSDGLVERFNRTLLNMLSTCSMEHPSDWDLYLSKLCLAYNSSMQSTTGYSPFFLMFGREARLPIDLIYNLNRDQEGTADKSYSTYVNKQREQFAEAYEKVRQNVSQKNATSLSNTIVGSMASPLIKTNWFGCSILQSKRVNHGSSTDLGEDHTGSVKSCLMLHTVFSIQGTISARLPILTG